MSVLLRKEPNDDDDDHGDILVGNDRDDRDGDESFLLSGIFFSDYCKKNSKPDFHGDGDDEDNNQNCRDHAAKNAHLLIKEFSIFSPPPPPSSSASFASSSN